MEHCVYTALQKYSGCKARNSTASGIALTKLADLWEEAVCVNTKAYLLGNQLMSPISEEWYQFCFYEMLEYKPMRHYYGIAIYVSLNKIASF